MADQLSGSFRLRSSRSDLPPGYLQRPRLTAMLDAGAGKAVTVVCAGPGYGKTLAVSAWSRLGNLPGPVAWLTADDSYDVRGLWTDLLDTLRVLDVLPTGGPLSEITPAPQFGDPELNRIVDALMDLPTPIVLVIDDFHNIADPDVLDSLSRVVEYRIPHLRLILVTRTEPQLRLSRLRLADEVSDISADDLTYTSDEVRGVSVLSGSPLPDGDVVRLQSRTQGWPAGLRLAMLSVNDSHRETPTLDHFGGDNRRVAEYLLEEILDQLSPSDRLFLLATSVVDQMTADLARALSGRTDSQQVLETLVARNALTVRLSERPNWFRYHPLLREMLFHRLSAEDPDGVPAQNRLAAEWFESVNEPILAIRHYALARDWVSVALLLGEVALPLIVTPHATALVAALASGYDEVSRRPTPETLLAATLVDYQRHDYHSMMRYADGAADLMDAATDPVPPVYRVMVAMARMVHARAAAPGALVEASTALLELATALPRQQVPAAPAYALIATNNYASGLVLEGSMDQAQPILTAAKA